MTSGIVTNIANKGDKAAQIQAAIGVHGMWKQRINQAISTGKSEWDWKTVAQCNACDFGKWLESFPAHEKNDYFHQVNRLHADFHKEAARVLQMAVSGRTDEARAATGQSSAYTQLTSQLTLAMMNWKKAV